MERKIKNSKVAVIGGAGFLGSHLVKHLIEDRDCEVLVLDNLIAGQKKFIHEKAKFMWCDITHSESELRRIFRTNAIDPRLSIVQNPNRQEIANIKLDGVDVCPIPSTIIFDTPNACVS